MSRIKGCANNLVISGCYKICGPQRRQNVVSARMEINFGMSASLCVCCFRNAPFTASLGWKFSHHHPLMALLHPYTDSERARAPSDSIFFPCVKRSRYDNLPGSWVFLYFHKYCLCLKIQLKYFLKGSMVSSCKLSEFLLNFFFQKRCKRYICLFV